MVAKATLTRALLLKKGLCSKQFVRHAGYWNKDWKPGPYPKTEAERLAAAKKYGLLPQDYEPYPDDGTGYGDYPKLPVVSADARDPFYNWDYPDQKRNYGETLNVDWDKYIEERITSAPQRFDMKTKATYLGTVLGIFALLWGICEINGWYLQWNLVSTHFFSVVAFKKFYFYLLFVPPQIIWF